MLLISENMLYQWCGRQCQKNANWPGI